MPIPRPKRNPEEHKRSRSGAEEQLDSSFRLRRTSPLPKSVILVFSNEAILESVDPNELSTDFVRVRIRALANDKAPLTLWSATE